MTFAELLNEITVSITEKGRQQAFRDAQSANENQYASELQDGLGSAAYITRCTAIYDAMHPAGWASR